MPNHVINKLVVITENETELKNFLNSIKNKEDDNRVIDFNNILPMPEELKNTEASTRIDDAILYFLYKENRFDECEKYLSYPRKLENIKTFDTKEEKECNEMYELGKYYIGLYDKYGYKNWYEWSKVNWGTKWNAYNTYYDYVEKNEACIMFTTAWVDVAELIQELAKQNPNIDFEYKCASEDIGTCCVNAYSNDDEEGELYIEFLEYNSEEALETYCECWAEDFENFYVGEDGYWRNRIWEEDDDDWE